MTEPYKYASSFQLSSQLQFSTSYSEFVTFLRQYLLLLTSLFIIDRQYLTPLGPEICVLIVNLEA